MKILIVEDSKSLVAGLIHVLNKKISAEIFTVSSKSECAKILLKEKGKFDIAILDLGLPDAQDGEIVPFISKFKIPSIILTATEHDKSNPIFNNDNIIDYVIKNGSYSLDYTAYVVERFIENSKIDVLIVDDSKTFVAKTQDLCLKYNIKTIPAFNAEEALEIMSKKNNIKLILVDYIMPRMDGLEFTTKIRQTYKKDELSIIALSASKDKSVIAKFLKYGANDFIYKDFSNEEFYARINSSLEIIKLFENSRDRANKDYMTGMYNRRYLFEKGKEIYKKAKKNKENLSCAIIDIDKFKNINDTYGHDVGDVAIKQIPKILEKFLDERSLISRMGGEEFCIITEDLNEKEIQIVYQNIRIAFEESTLEVDDLKLKYTVSIGLNTSYEDDFDEMLKKADEGLYQAKETGRNKVVLFNKEY
ncbi:MAG: diguanylate cyclase [Campylobacteraceae bacterium]|nr:diguanylate cyclase [Campylobacteraceae bacterium]